MFWTLDLMEDNWNMWTECIIGGLFGGITINFKTFSSIKVKHKGIAVNWQ